MLVYLKKDRFQTFGFEAESICALNNSDVGLVNETVPLRLEWKCLKLFWLVSYTKKHPKKNISGLVETNPLKAAGILDIFQTDDKNDHYPDHQICT